MCSHVGSVNQPRKRKSTAVRPLGSEASPPSGTVCEAGLSPWAFRNVTVWLGAKTASMLKASSSVKK